MQKGKGIVGKVAETLKPLRINDVATSSEYNPEVDKISDDYEVHKHVDTANNV